jgi:hypothetical protein
MTGATSPGFDMSAIAPAAGTLVIDGDVTGNGDLDVGFSTEIFFPHNDYNTYSTVGRL